MTRNVGKYQLVRKLATGGMAEVFLAKAAGPRGFEKTLVVKCILPHLAQEPSFVEMFHSEAMLAARLSHPHVVQIFDFGEVEGSYFIAMEYIDGPSLRTLIKRASAQRIPLPPAVCARLVSQACEGLAFAHDFVDVGTGQPLGLIHRDVSPDNLLLSLQGSVKVVDFGIAKATGQGHQTASGVVKGKLAYMPPEQLRGKSLDRRVDVYALGVVLYELLTFHKPHAAANEAALMHSILFDAPVPAEHHRPDLPESLRRILARATAKDREQRYPDCHALQADLEDFIHSEGRLVTAQQVAQLIQRATAGAGVPVQPPSLVPTRLAPVAPGPTRPALEPSAPEPLSRTELDTTPEAPRSEDDWRTQQETSPFGGVGSMGAPRDRSRFPEPPAWTREPTRTRPELDARWRPSRWTRRALVGAVLVLTGTGLVWEARGRMVDRSETTQVAAPPPARAEVTPTPAVPTPAVPTPAPAPSGEEPGARAEAPSSETAPEAKPPAARQRSARPPKARRSTQVAAMGWLDMRSQPYAEVSVDGRSVGTTPLDGPVELAAGDHTVKFYSPTLKRTEVRHIEVAPGKTTPLNISFPKER